VIRDASFEELVLYFSSRSDDDPKFSATKLNMLIFFADFLAYAYLGKPIWISRRSCSSNHSFR